MSSAIALHSMTHTHTYTYTPTHTLTHIHTHRCMYRHTHLAAAGWTNERHHLSWLYHQGIVLQHEVKKQRGEVKV